MAHLKFFAFVVIISFAFLGVSNALQCYLCKYTEDYENPHNCKDNPDSSVLQTIDDILVPGGFSSSYGRNGLVADRNSNSLAIASSPVHLFDRQGGNQPSGYYPFTYCVKYTGKDVVTGREVVHRLGMGFKNNGAVRLGCQDYVPDGIQLPGVDDVRICFCNTHACNGATSLVKKTVVGFLPIILSVFYAVYSF